MTTFGDSKIETNIFPLPSITAGGGGILSELSHGLTKREYFAAKAMQAMLSNSKTLWGVYDADDFTDLDLCHDAVNMADALIKALNEIP